MFGSGKNMNIEEVLGSTTRLHIMRVLVKHFAPYWLRQIQREIGAKSVGGLSKHIDVLEKAGLVRVTERGHYKSFVANESDDRVRFLRKLFNAAERVGS